MLFINICSLFLEENKTGCFNESSASQRIHMKNQALFSSKDKKKKKKKKNIKMSSAAIFVWRFKAKLPTFNNEVSQYDVLLGTMNHYINDQFERNLQFI